MRIERCQNDLRNIDGNNVNRAYACREFDWCAILLLNLSQYCLLDSDDILSLVAAVLKDLIGVAGLQKLPSTTLSKQTIAP